MKSPVEPSQPHHHAAWARCQRLLRLTTAIILTAFALIILTTTFFTGPWVQVIGKTLYYVIVLGALFSLGTWYYRTRLEKNERRSNS